MSVARSGIGLALLAVVAGSPLAAAIDADMMYDDCWGLYTNWIGAVAVGPSGEIYAGGDMGNLGGAPLYVGRVDNRLHPDLAFDAAADSFVRALAVQNDGRLLAGGDFLNIGGEAKTRLARLLPDASADPSFGDPAPDASVRALALEANGRIVAGGEFATIGGQPRVGLARLFPTGALDLTFPAVSGGSATVHAIVVLRDGRIVVGGDFTHVGGLPRANLARILPSGVVDAAFTAGTDGPVRALYETQDRSLLVGGLFATLAGQPRANLGRFDAAGALDAAFDPGTDGAVNAFVEQPDGRIVVGGNFDVLAGAPATLLGRLHPDGQRDPAEGTTSPTLHATFGLQWTTANGEMLALGLTIDGRVLATGAFALPSGCNEFNAFHPNGYLMWATRPYDGPPTNGSVLAVAQFPGSGDILVGGDFLEVSGAAAQRSARLLNDTWTFPVPHLAPFPTASPGPVRAVAVDRAGRALVCGNFTEIGGQSRNGLARILADGSVDPAFLPPAGPVPDCHGLDLDESGRILVAYWGTAGGVRRLLDADGSLDPTFVVATTPVLNRFREIAALPGGKILVAGGSVSDGSAHPKIVRLNADGSLDPMFTSPTLTPPSGVPTIAAIGVAPDQTITISGRFDQVDGTARPGLARLLPGGALDTTFVPDPTAPNNNNQNGAILPLAGGRAYVAGRFTWPAACTASCMVVRRYESDGETDPDFEAPWTGGALFDLQVLPNGDLQFGHGVSGLTWTNEDASSTRVGIARLRPQRTIVRRLIAVAPSVHWILDAYDPELRQVRFELSTDGGGSWTPLGAGVRVADGWRLDGLALPQQQPIRVRALGEYRTGGGLAQWADDRGYWIANGDGEPIFADDFEIGSSANWSASVP